MDSEKVYLSVDERYSTAACGFSAEYNDTVAKALWLFKRRTSVDPQGGQPWLKLWQSFGCGYFASGKLNTRVLRTQPSNMPN